MTTNESLDGAGMVKDPVCGMSVDPRASKQHAIFAGKSYHFCSRSCRESFEVEPNRYLATAMSTKAAIQG